MKIKYFTLLLFFFLTACATRPHGPDWTEKTIKTKYLSFQVWEKNVQEGGDLRLYIEGDGSPTPERPIAFELAKRDPHPNVIYISRPCQYVNCAECLNPALWHEERFNEEIVNEMKSLVVHLSHKYKSPALDLIGYDGGGTMAMLLATRIPVRQVITVGGILDTQAYASAHNISLNGLNPANFRRLLSPVRQVHYVGSADKDTPPEVAEHFVTRLDDPRSAVIKSVPGATHTDWRGLIVE